MSNWDLIRISKKDKKKVDVYRAVRREIDDSLKPLSQAEVIHRTFKEANFDFKTQQYLEELKQKNPDAYRRYLKKLKNDNW